MVRDSRRRTSDGARLLAACALTLAAACGEAPAAKQHDVVLIIVDTLRGDMVGNPERAKTPALDRLAADGVRFDRAFSHAPMTLPSHTSLFASRAPSFTRVTNNWQNVPEDLPLLAEWMRDHGYGTHAVLSLGTLNPHEGGPGLDRGFETYDLHYWHMDRAPGAFERMQQTLDAVDRTKPLFLFAHFSDPHSPYNANGSSVTTAEVRLDGEVVDTVSTSEMTQWERTFPLDAGAHVFEVRSERPFHLKVFEWKRDGAFAKPTWETGEESLPAGNALNKQLTEATFRAELPEAADTDVRFWIAEAITRDEIPAHYRGEVELVDRYVGELIDELDRRGLYDDSIVVFTSDHGEALGEHGVTGQHVQNLHDEMLHVPLIVKLPAGHPGRERLADHRNEVVAHQDIVPTILSLVGLPPLPGQLGSSLLVGPTDVVVSQTHRPEAREDSLALRNERYKLIYRPEQDRFELFDLKSDPRELHDVFEREVERIPAEWGAELRLLAESVAEGIPPEKMAPEVFQKLQELGYIGSDSEDELQTNDESGSAEAPGSNDE